MIPWNVARSRAPAQLSNPVGPAAGNLKHDVALVQALLLAARRPTGGAYYQGPIDGRYSATLAEALTHFRAERALATGAAPVGPMHAWDPAFQALARVDPTLAVLYGTTTVYSSDWNAAAPLINQNHEPIKLSAAMFAGLQLALADLERTTGIRLDVKVEPVGLGVPRTVARLFPQGLAVLAADGRQQAIGHPNDLTRLAPGLEKALRDVVDNLMTQRIGLSAAARAQNTSRSDMLTFVLRSEADRFETVARNIVAEWRQRGWTMAPRFLEYYLAGKGRADPQHPDIVLSQAEALSFAPIREAVRANVTRFITQNLEANPPETKTPEAQAAMEKVRGSDNVSRTFMDCWEYTFRYLDLNPISAEEPLKLRMLSLLKTEADLVRAVGETTVASLGEFTVSRRGRELLIGATIAHRWADIYDFHVIFGAESRYLERDRGARPFSWRALWFECREATITLDNEWTRPFSQVPCSGHESAMSRVARKFETMASCKDL